MSRYGPEYWDKYGSYRTPIAFHLSVLVLLRAYFIWIVAGLSRRPELDLMSIFFKSKNDFFIAIAIGAIAIVPIILFCLRRPRESHKSSERLAKSLALYALASYFVCGNRLNLVKYSSGS